MGQLPALSVPGWESRDSLLKLNTRTQPGSPPRSAQAGRVAGEGRESGAGDTERPRAREEAGVSTLPGDTWPQSESPSDPCGHPTPQGRLAETIPPAFTHSSAHLACVY